MKGKPLKLPLHPFSFPPLATPVYSDASDKLHRTAPVGGRTNNLVNVFGRRVRPTLFSNRGFHPKELRTHAPQFNQAAHGRARNARRTLVNPLDRARSGL